MQHYHILGNLEGLAATLANKRCHPTATIVSCVPSALVAEPVSSAASRQPDGRCSF